MQTNYGVKIVGDDALPDDIDFMFVKTTGGEVLLYMGRSAARNPRALAEAWASYRCIEAGKVRVPSQRPALEPLGR